jgi:hypothetical protein
VKDQARRHGVEHLAQREAGGRDADGEFLIIAASPLGQLLEPRTLDIDALAIAGIAAADDLIDEAAVAGQIVEIARAPHQQRVIDLPLEMTVRTFDGAVLVRDSAIVAGRRHAVVGDELSITARQVLPGSPV